MKKGSFGLLGAVMLCLALAGCGGGGDDGTNSNNSNNDSNNNSNDNTNDDNNDDTNDPKPNVAEGLYRGTTSDSRELSALLLDDGTYWVLYSGAGAPTVGGGLQGAGSVDGTLFTSSEGKDFSLTEGMRDAAIRATYMAGQRFQGSVTFEGGDTFTFDAAYDDAYAATPSLTQVAGSHAGVAYTVDGSLPTLVTIADDGMLVGTRGSCTITGTIAPHSHGNVYDLSLSFGGDACIVLGATVEGVALIDSTSGLVTASALNGDRSVGFIFAELPLE